MNGPSRFLFALLVGFVSITILVSCGGEDPDGGGAAEQPGEMEAPEEGSEEPEVSPEPEKEEGGAGLPAMGVLNDVRVNFRSAPRLTAGKLGQLNEPDEIAVFGRTRDRQVIGDLEAYWLRIRSADEVDGWIYGAFVDVPVPDAQLPVIDDADYPGEIPTDARVPAIVVADREIFAAVVDPTRSYSSGADGFAVLPDQFPFEKVTVTLGGMVDPVERDGMHFVAVPGKVDRFFEVDALLPVPFYGTIEGKDTVEGSPLFYGLTQSSDGGDEVIIHSRADIYKVMDFRQGPDGLRFHITTGEDTKAKGWIDERFFRIDFETSRRYFVLDHLFPYDVEGSPARIATFLGEPAAHYVRDVENRHNDSIDRVHSMIYRGLTLVVYEVTLMEKYIPFRIVVSDPAVPMIYPVRFGITRREIVDLLGKPDESGPTWVEYLGDSFGYSSTTFGMEDEALVSLNYYVQID